MIRIASGEHVEQLAALLTAHAAAALPGAAVSADSVAARLDRDPGDFVLDPWIETRETLVATVRDRVVAAGQLCRFADEPRVGDAYRGAAELRWFCFWPGEQAAAAALLDRAIERAQPFSRFHLTGDPPGVLVYGIPDAWPHVEALARERGFEDDGGRTEVLLTATLAKLPGPESETARRNVAWSGDALLIADTAKIEVAVEGRLGQLWGPFADDGGVEPDAARRLWLEAFEWLRLAGCDRVVAALEEDEIEPAAALGLRPITRLRRGWTLASRRGGGR
jgi:hypothetical protein